MDPKKKKTRLALQAANKVATELIEWTTNKKNKKANRVLTEKKKTANGGNRLSHVQI